MRTEVAIHPHWQLCPLAASLSSLRPRTVVLLHWFSKLGHRLFLRAYCRCGLLETPIAQGKQPWLAGPVSSGPSAEGGPPRGQAWSSCIISSDLGTSDSPPIFCKAVSSLAQAQKLCRAGQGSLKRTRRLSVMCQGQHALSTSFRALSLPFPQRGDTLSQQALQVCPCHQASL